MPLFLKGLQMKNIDIWYCSINNIGSDFESYENYFSGKRQEKIRRVKPIEEKKRSVCAGILMEKFCQSEGLSVEDIFYSEKGKPYLKGERIIPFNLSHSGEYVVLAFVREEKTGLQIGVDIQEKRRTNIKFSERILSEQEKIDSQKRSIIEYWSVKEAFSKLTGTGISTDFRDLFCDFQKEICENKKEDTFCYFKEVHIAEQYEAYVCLTEEIGELSIKEFTMDLLEL